MGATVFAGRHGQFVVDRGEDPKPGDNSNSQDHFFFDFYSMSTSSLNPKMASVLARKSSVRRPSIDALRTCDYVHVGVQRHS